MVPEPLSILFQDDYLVAIDKPAGHLVHPADEPQADDLVAMKILRDQIGQRVHPIHRLDRPTCGVLLFGLEQEAAKHLHRAFELREVSKTYHALVEGDDTPESWTNSTPLQKSPEHPFKEASTVFKTLRRGTIKGRAFSLIACSPVTGRFHQIRQHLLESGYPIVGDYRYNDIAHCNLISDLLETNQRMLLQAHALTFPHPHSATAMTIHCPAPSYFPSL